MNGHRSDPTKMTLLPVNQYFVSSGHSLVDFGRSKMYIIDYNPSWKENQGQKKREFLNPRVTNTTSGEYEQQKTKYFVVFYVTITDGHVTIFQSR